MEASVWIGQVGEPYRSTPATSNIASNITMAITYPLIRLAPHYIMSWVHVTDKTILEVFLVLIQGEK